MNRISLLPADVTPLRVPIYVAEWQVVELWQPLFRDPLPGVYSLSSLEYFLPGIVVEGGHVTAACFSDLGVEELPKSLLRLPCLQFLNIAICNLRALPAWIPDLPALKWLWVDVQFYPDPVARDCQPRGVKVAGCKEYNYIPPFGDLNEWGEEWAEKNRKFDQKFWGKPEKDEWEDEEEDDGLDEETKKKWGEIIKKMKNEEQETTAACFRRIFDD